MATHQARQPTRPMFAHIHHRIILIAAAVCLPVFLATVEAAGPALAIALNSGDGTLSLIDTETYRVVGKTQVCKEPHHLMPSPDDKSVIVACAASNQLVFSDPYHLGFSPDRKLFVSNSLRLDRVDFYDTADFKLKARVHAPRTPSHMAFDAAGEMVFITLQDSNEVMAISLKTLKTEWVIPVGPTPAGIVMTPDNRYLLVAIMGEGYVEVIDWKTQKTVKKVPTDIAAHNLHPRGDGRYYFVSNRSVKGGSISLFDTQTLTVVEKYDVPGGPDDMEVRADGKELWATARFARRVQVIDLTTKMLKTSIPVGSSPHGVFFLNHAGRK